LRGTTSRTCAISKPGAQHRANSRPAPVCACRGEALRYRHANNRTMAVWLLSRCGPLVPYRWYGLWPIHQTLDCTKGSRDDKSVAIFTTKLTTLTAVLLGAVLPTTRSRCCIFTPPSLEPGPDDATAFPSPLSTPSTELISVSTIVATRGMIAKQGEHALLKPMCSTFSPKH
jgi:hypothetical protein